MNSETIKVKIKDEFIEVGYIKEEEIEQNVEPNSDLDKTIDYSEILKDINQHKSEDYQDE